MSRYREAKLQKMTVRAMETLPALLLGLSTGKPGDENEPIVLDSAETAAEAAAAARARSWRRNLEPPTDSDDSDFEDSRAINSAPTSPAHESTSSWRPD